MMKNILFLALGIGFLLFGFAAFQQSKPDHKNQRVYTEVKKFSPYYLEKRFGGLQILSKEDKEFKEKPDNMEVFHRLEKLEHDWGQKHLKIEQNHLIIRDANGKTLDRMELKTDSEKAFVKNYYGVK